MLVTISTSHANDLNIVTGSKSGTYIQIGNDIAKLASQDGITIGVMESTGSLTNAYAVRYTPDVQLGIVQSDVLGYLKIRADNVTPGAVAKEDIPKLKNLIESLKLVMPLYTEEVHILARKEIKNLTDLAGKIVSFGRHGSGTSITAEQVFRSIGVQVKPEYGFAPDDALNYLKDGHISAMVYVVGQPAKLFTQTINAGDGLHFLNTDEAGISERLLVQYDTATLERTHYPWMERDVATVGVRSLLIAYNYRGEENCANIGRVAKSIQDNLSALRSSGHEKWNNVNLSAPVGSWDRYDCVSLESAAPPAPAADGGKALPDFLKKLRR